MTGKTHIGDRGMGMQDSVIQSAALIFTGSAILVGISLMLISSTWKTLKGALATLPGREKKILFNLKNIPNRRSRLKAELMSALFLGCILLGFSVACNVISMFGVSRIMLGLHPGLYLEQDYGLSAHLLPVSVALFSSGMLAIGIVRLLEAISLARGKENPLLW